MNVFSDTISFFSASIDSLWQEYGQSFCDDTACTSEFPNMEPSTQDIEDDFPLATCDNLDRDIMVDDGDYIKSANDLGDFSELMRAPLETASTQDTCSGLAKATVQAAPSQRPEEKALATVKSADIPPVFKIPVVNQPPTPVQVPKRPTLTVPSLAKAAGCGSSTSGGGWGRSFHAQEVGQGLIARGASAKNIFMMIPLLPCKASFSSEAADRARQVACKQQRLYARQKLDAKRLRWKQAAATLAQANAAVTGGNTKLSKYPKRQQAANGRSRTAGGKFQMENKGVFLSASQL
jgi:hypothetical protein